MGHGDDSPRPGFDRWVSFVGQGVYVDPQMNIDGETSNASGYMTDILTDYTVSFIEDIDERPFFAFVAHKASHPEIHPNYVRSFPPAKGDESLYQGKTLLRNPNWKASTAGKPALARPVDYSDPRSPQGGLPDEIILNRLRMLSAVDRGLGRLIDVLEKRELLDDTVFVLSSDQGFFYGEFGLAQERRLAYEASIHIPLIIRYPQKVRPGLKPEALASNVDVAPTMLALAGSEIPVGLDGFSLVPALADPSQQIREDLLIEYYSDEVFPRIQHMGYHALRTHQYKYIRYTELDNMDELYDLQSDPYELDNLLPTRAPPELTESMSTRIDALFAR
jgi:arylsulfatase A-like enzyme